jgi:hypothetical protein
MSDYEALRALAVAALAVALAGCGAGLYEDDRPLNVDGACAQQPDGKCDGLKVGG